MLSSAELEVTVEEWEWRKSFYEFDEEDVDRLVAVREMAEEFVDDVVGQLYETLLQHQETHRILKKLDSLDRLKDSQRRYFMELFEGAYDEEYLRSRLKVGRIHHQIGLDLEWYQGAYVHYLRLVRLKLTAALGMEAEPVLDSLYKLIALDQSLAVTTYMSAWDASTDNDVVEIEPHISELG